MWLRRLSLRLADAMARFVSKFRLTVPAGKATPQPPVGSAFGQRGLNIMNFCKAFNDQTSHIVENTPMQVLISTRADRSFEFVVNSPRTTWFLKRRRASPRAQTSRSARRAGGSA